MNEAKMNVEIYEIPNTFTPDLSLDRQIDLGINDWRAECGRMVAFGHTESEARENITAMIEGRL